MPKNDSPEKRRARALQAETGKPYQECLNEIRAIEVPKQPEPAPSFPAPTTSGLFSHA